MIEQPRLPIACPWRKRGVGIVNVGVFNSGVLVKGLSGATYDYGAVPENVNKKVKCIEAICDAYQ